MNGNLIDKQKAIMDVESWVAVDEHEKRLQKNVIEWLREFPPVQLSTDAISRQAALNAMETWDKFVCGPDGKLVRCYDKHYIPYIPYVRYEDMVHVIKHLSPVQPESQKFEVYKSVSMQEVIAELGASTVHTTQYFAYCLYMLDFLGFSICKKEVNKGENNNVNDKGKN